MIASGLEPKAGIWAVLLLGLSIDVVHPAEPVTQGTGVPRGELDLVRHDAGRAVGSAREPAASAHRPFEGFWAANRAACRDPDSDQRMAIGANTIDWYETRCRIHAIASAGRGAWHLDLTCHGEGQSMKARATASLPTLDTLTIDDGPIGPARRQRYIRCEIR